MAESSWVRRPLELLLGLAIAVVVVAIAVGAVRFAFGMNGAPFDGTMMSWGMSALMVFVWVVFGLAVAGIVVWALFSFAPGLPGGRAGSPFGTPSDWSTYGAVSELKKRYARGMINREEYLKTLEDLERATQPYPTPVQK